ncbi:MAG: hypothetical protein PHQ66_01075 [Candidatus Nanoarchaeia archaeon]|nr:hypothetical protein [Candidatus Nanoarchaeia archaeon]MDD5358029.1 hypothetical protein [Candidatus Nanoarchaeia archaeon]MDD5588948.1 hypothetical protein [Candidatus Nanoarchaeia archaeon]
MEIKRWKFYFGVIILIGFFTIISCLILSSLKIPACNDETPFNNCSEIKPYFCSNGTLIEKASVCGCRNSAKIDGDKCISEYQTQPKNIALNYTLNGKKGEINFVAYKNLSDYLSDIPRYITPVDGEEATLRDFRMKSLDEKKQRELLLPLVVAIENSAKNRDDQARIAVSIVQNIPFGSSNKTIKLLDLDLEYYRYPYEVLYDVEGVCGEKSELLSFLLRELGYETAFLYFPNENHEAIGIKCPARKSFNSVGYCFIETTGPSIITDYKTEYVSVGQLDSFYEIIPIEGNLSFGESNFYEYSDAKTLNKIRQTSREYGAINYIEHLQFRHLVEKYGLVTFEYKF